MAVVYIVSCLIVVFWNIGLWPQIFADIFKGAFTPAGVTGGAVGSMMLCITWGVKRGVFSNEAGLGSAPMAHAASSEKDPVRQGLYGIFEVFMDTIVVCSLSGLTVLCGFYAGGLDGLMSYGTQGDTSLNAAALGTVFGAKGGAVIIAVCLALFAFSTVLSWGMYGTRCCEFLLGPKSIKPYQIIFVLVVIVGATMNLSLAWDIADTLNGLMAIPNLIALVGLSGIVVKETKDYFENRIKNYE
jgi:AGCS family alanine or glycine:cation symporter